MRKIREDIVREISKETGYSCRAIDKIIKAFFKNVIKELSLGNEVVFKGFGVFKVKQRAARTGKNLHTGETVKISSCSIPSFVPAKQFKNNIK